MSRILLRVWGSHLCGLAIVLATISGLAEDSTPHVAPAADPANPPVERDEEYYEMLRLFADTLDQVERNYVKDVSRRDLMEAAIKGMLSKLDPYSNYIAPTDLDRFKTGIENEFGGIGIQVTTEPGELTIISPMFNTPAYRAGIEAGDHITEINGQPTKGISIDEAVKRMKGPIGSTVKVTVWHARTKETETVEVKREMIQVETVLGDKRKEDDHWSYWFDEEKKIGYIRVTQFGRHTFEELRKAVRELNEGGIKGLVIDLRYNPGGLLTSAIEICDLFIKTGKIVSTAGRNVPERTWNAHEPGTFDGFPVAVLVNRFSASASEIVSACLQDHSRAVVIGERTWGKGSVQNIIELESGKSALKLTTAGYLRPSGKNIHRFDGAKENDEWGVTPNEGFAVALTDEEAQAYLTNRRERDILRKASADSEAKPIERLVDKQLQKALDYLDEQLKPKADGNAAAKADAKAEEKKDEKKE
jgi:carboxyl-terminal processing protease